MFGGREGGAGGGKTWNLNLVSRHTARTISDLTPLYYDTASLRDPFLRK